MQYLTLNNTAAQVILRWLIQRSVVVNCKSTRKERMAENIDHSISSWMKMTWPK